MPKKLKFGNAILCEHVVQGANNKHTLVNVYSGDVIVGTLPADLSFGVYVEMEPGAPDEMSVELQLDGKAFAKMTAAFRDGRRDQTSNFIIPFIQMGISEDREFSVVAMAEGFSRTTFIKKRIFKGQVPTSPTS